MVLIVDGENNWQIVAVDPIREAYEVGLPFIREAGVEHKIKFIHSDAFSALDEMLTKVIK